MPNARNPVRAALAVPPMILLGRGREETLI